ncbi:MAG: spore coat associated protein CotJA [Clostridia bacterium]|nr:spore coat associated protein CotJA [Clostridia bacterium]
MPDNDVLAMAFVNVQHINSVYDDETGFSSGTIYPCLDKPFMPGGTAR